MKHFQELCELIAELDRIKEAHGDGFKIEQHNLTSGSMDQFFMPLGFNDLLSTAKKQALFNSWGEMVSNAIADSMTEIQEELANYNIEYTGDKVHEEI